METGNNPSDNRFKGKDFISIDVNVESEIYCYSCGAKNKIGANNKIKKPLLVTVDPYNIKEENDLGTTA